MQCRPFKESCLVLVAVDEWQTDRRKDGRTDGQMEAPMQSNQLTLEDKSPNNDDNDANDEDRVLKGSVAGERASGWSEVRVQTSSLPTLKAAGLEHRDTGQCR